MKSNKAYRILRDILNEHGEKNERCVGGIIFNSQFNDVVRDIMLNKQLPKILLEGKKVDKLLVGQNCFCMFHDEGDRKVTISNIKIEKDTYYYTVKERPNEGWIHECRFSLIDRG